MAEVIEGVKYSEKHEWIKIDGDRVEIGITDYAQANLGDIVFIELPESGREIEKEESFGTIESVKAVDELYAPLSGEVVAANEELDADPGQVNQAPYQAWIVKLKLKDTAELDALMSAEDYQKYLETLD